MKALFHMICYENGFKEGKKGEWRHINASPKGRSIKENAAFKEPALLVILTVAIMVVLVDFIYYILLVSD